MRTDSLAVVAGNGIDTITNIRYILSNHLNPGIINLKTVVQLLETEEDAAKRQELLILLSTITASLERSMVSVNNEAYNEPGL